MENKYSTEFYLTDPKFKQWIIDSNESLDRYWQSWLKRYPDSKAAIDEAKLILTTATFKEYKITEETKKAIWHNVDNSINSPGKISQLRYILINWDYYSKIAAILIISILSSYVIFDLATDQPSVQQLVVQNIVKTTDWGERLTFQLQDGTEVKLNAGSTLTYPERFIYDERKVVLSGEAFFKVAKDSHMPFRVVSGSIVTEALGTEFYINNYSGHDSTIVALTEGKVRVSSNQDDIIMEPGQTISYQSNTKKIKSYDYIDERLTSWSDNVLIFEHANWPEIENRLERWYGVEIKNNNTQNKWDYSAKFKNYSLENVLKSICYAKNLKFEIDEDRVIIK